MPHLAIEYSPGLDGKVDFRAFLSAMRDAIIAAPGDFPLGGVRVRAHRADHAVVADGAGHQFMHMTLSIGAGRDEATRKAAGEAIYSAAERFLRPVIGDASFALSFEMRVMTPETAIKRWNTIRDHLGKN